MSVASSNFHRESKMNNIVLEEVVDVHSSSVWCRTKQGWETVEVLEKLGHREQRLEKTENRLGE